VRRTARLEADLGVVLDAVNVAPRTVVAIPPSDVDPVWDEMRKVVGGVVISVAFDPGEDIVTGAPIAYKTVGGNTYVTVSGAPYVKTIQ
jgi:hypothetical protein